MLFNEIILTYSEINKIEKLKIEVVEEKKHSGIINLFAGYDIRWR